MDKIHFVSLLLVFTLANLVSAQIQVSPDHKFLTTKDGQPFFWLGDTDWELFHRLTREEAEQFIHIRSEQEYNVLQAVALVIDDASKKFGAPGK